MASSSNPRKKSDMGCCFICWHELVPVLVSRTGRPPRHRVLQCANHCDMKCPKCDNTLRINREDKASLHLRCYRCHWTGEGLSENDLEKWKRSSKSRSALNKVRKEWALITPTEGSPCHGCGRPLRVFKTEAKQTSADFFTWTVTVFCSRGKCDFRKIRTQMKSPTSLDQWMSFKRHENRKLLPLHMRCYSCGQMPNATGYCACS